MEWIGWVLAVVLLVVVVYLVLRQRRFELSMVEERATLERRWSTDAQVVMRHAEDAAALVRSDAQRTLEQARERAKEVMEDLDRRRDELETSMATQRTELRQLRAAHERQEARLHEREDRLTADAEGLQARSDRLETQRQQLREQKQALSAERERVEAELERVAGLSRAQAHDEVMNQAEHEARLAATILARDIEQAALRDADRTARNIVVAAIQRCAAEQTNESVISSVTLPSDDMKGRIIGREGRNIRAFEQVTGVNVLIDDTPETVLLSSFDPVRRETARLTLVDLVADGRIHPVRIEEVHERSERQMGERVQRAAEDALAEVGITDLDPALIPTVGTLAFRTSYGQNVLRHSVETAHLAGVMAGELGLDVPTCKRAAFLHDIGKALTHEQEGPHALIGAELLRRHGEHADICHAVEAHHNEVEPETVEALLVQAADAISGSRPGARREPLEAYVKRMEQLEAIAQAHEGVQKAYAMQSGHEVRVMVSPEAVDDAGAHALARDIARQVERQLSYPGSIRITVVRESRATETAH